MFPLNIAFQQNTTESIKDKYKILNKIGSGHTSTVKKIKQRDSGEIFAVKVFKKSRMSEQQILNAQQEASILAFLNHSKILKF